ncbi:MAG: hypothetical protein J6T10_06420 [Methanobrevibacter sp.]|jgi:uncharacterized small protein (DUF1192 family)|nr:hypothetical protein [Methanobrevibacter sp.]
MIIEGFNKIGQFLNERLTKSDPQEMSDEELELLSKQDLIAYINILKGEKSILKREKEKLAAQIMKVFLNIK